MAAKTYYPTFLRLCTRLLRYATRYAPAMVLALGIGGTTFASDLATLITTLNQVVTNWPPYRETQ